MAEPSQAQGHSFEVDTICGGLEGITLPPKKVTLRTDMTLTQLEYQFKGLFYKEYMYMLEVHWKGQKKPEEIGEENCSEILRKLKQSGVGHKVVPYYDRFDPKGPSPIFKINTECGGEVGKGFAPKQITLRSDMTFEDLKKAFQDLFCPGPISKLEVHWGSYVNVVGKENYSEVLDCLKGEGKGRKLIPHYNWF